MAVLEHGINVLHLPFSLKGALTWFVGIVLILLLLSIASPVAGRVGGMLGRFGVPSSNAGQLPLVA